MRIKNNDLINNIKKKLKYKKKMYISLVILEILSFNFYKNGLITFKNTKSNIIKRKEKKNSIFKK